MAYVPLDLDTTKAVLRRYAREERCLSYSQLASGLNRPNPAMAGPGMAEHLQRLIRSESKKGPCLSSIVVNQNDFPSDYRIGTVVMNEGLESFVSDARDAGYEGPKDPKAFLRYHQLLTFAWSLTDP